MLIMEQIGELEFDRRDLLGHGTFAIVYKGRYKEKPESSVAIKVIEKKRLQKAKNLLKQEIRILKELSELEQENLVRLLECLETTNQVFLVMEFCDSGDLADYLRLKGSLKEDEIRHLTCHIVSHTKTMPGISAGALEAITQKGIMHRDLKPQNILLCNSRGLEKPGFKDMLIKITDFGFARFLGNGSMAATFCGSPIFMAPEILMSLPYDAKADLFSLGVILFQCLTGKMPFQAKTPMQLKERYMKANHLDPQIPDWCSLELKDLLLRLLQKDVKWRIEFADFFEHSFLKLQPLNQPIDLRAIINETNQFTNSRGPKKTEEKSVKTFPTNMEEIDDFVFLPPLDLTPTPKKVRSLDANSQTSSQILPVPTQRGAYDKMKSRKELNAKSIPEVESITKLLPIETISMPRMFSPTTTLQEPSFSVSFLEKMGNGGFLSLNEEFLMPEEQKEQMNRLKFITRLIPILKAVVESKASPLNDLAISFCKNQTTVVNQNFEQLVLYEMILRILYSTLLYTKNNVALNKTFVTSSPSLKNIITFLNDEYRGVLRKVKDLDLSGIELATPISAEIILYSYSIDLCRSTTIEELLESSNICLQRYQNAHMLLHFLAEITENESRKNVFIKFKDTILKRLISLEKRGLMKEICD